MTKGRVVFPWRAMAGLKVLFITLSGPQAHDSSVEKHFQEWSPELQIPTLGMTEGREALPWRAAAGLKVFFIALGGPQAHESGATCCFRGLTQAAGAFPWDPDFFASDDTAYKAGCHELFERKQQLIFTDCCDHRFIKTVVSERLIFVDLVEDLAVVAEHDEIPNEVACRFAHGLYSNSPGNKPYHALDYAIGGMHLKAHNFKYN
jgi:hypothetical protein